MWRKNSISVDGTMDDLDNDEKGTTLKTEFSATCRFSRNFDRSDGGLNTEIAGSASSKTPFRIRKLSVAMVLIQFIDV